MRSCTTRSRTAASISRQVYPADFIAEGVDQTRGWFFTLHAIASMLFDSVAFKNIISNGLVLDKNGNKMSKRLGNAVDPFEVLGHLRSRRDALVHDLQLAAVGQPQVRQGRRRRSAPQILRNALQHLLVLRPLRQRGRLHGPWSRRFRWRSVPRSTAGSSRSSTRWSGT